MVTNVQKRVVTIFNPTIAQMHELQWERVSIEVRTQLIQNTQAAKQSRKMVFVTPPAGITLGGETLATVRKSAEQAGLDWHKKRIEQTLLLCSTKAEKVTSMSQMECDPWALDLSFCDCCNDYLSPTS